MRNVMGLFVIVFFVAILVMPISGAEAPKPGVSDHQQQKPKTRLRLADFKVDKVFIAKTDAPTVPVAGPFYRDEDYTFVCEISLTGDRNFTNTPESHCAGTESSATVALKIDGIMIVPVLTGCLALNEKKTISSHDYISNTYIAFAFSVGSHTFECLFNSTDISDGYQGYINNKSMSYQIINPHKTEQPNRPRPN